MMSTSVPRSPVGMMLWHLLQRFAGIVDVHDPALVDLLACVPQRWLLTWQAHVHHALTRQAAALVPPAPPDAFAIALAAWRAPYVGQGLTESEIDSRVQAARHRQQQTAMTQRGLVQWEETWQTWLTGMPPY